MTRPSRPIPVAVRFAASALLLAFVAACASQPQLAGVNANAPQEAAVYVAHARGGYIPPGPPEDPWGPYVREAAKRFDIPEEWVRAVMHVESNGQEYRDGQLITSNAGAMGLMQVMPQTYNALRDRYGLGPDPFDPHDNIIAGVAYMRELYDIYGSPGFLAAYNAGPWRLDDYLSDSRPLPAETRNYVAMIAPEIAGIYPAHLSPAQAYAMNDIPDDIPPGLRDGRVMLASVRHPAPLRHEAFRHGRMVARAVVRSRAERAGRPVEVAMVLPPPAPPRRPETQAQRRQEHREGFHLISEARAAEAIGSHGGGIGWAVQVGAFSNQVLAERAAGRAKTTAHFAAAHVAVESVRERHGKLWRARVTDLSRDAAEQACHRLAHRHGGCLVISPESRS